MARQLFKLTLEISFDPEESTVGDIVRQVVNSVDIYDASRNVEDYDYTEPELVEQEPEDDTHNDF